LGWKVHLDAASARFAAWQFTLCPAAQSRQCVAGQRQVPGVDDINATWPTLPISRVPAAQLSNSDLAGLLKLLLI